MAFDIDAIYAYIARNEPDGDEGVCATHTGEGWVPLVAADKTRLDELRPVAQGIADEMQVEVRLVRFTKRADLETLTPKARPRNVQEH